MLVLTAQRATAIAAPAPSLDPPAPPCPASGWLTAPSLVGGWQRSTRSHGYRGNVHWHVRTAERHDFRADGSAIGVRLVRARQPQDDLEKLLRTPMQPFREDREDFTGLWTVDAHGVREARWRSATRSILSRGRTGSAPVSRQSWPRARSS